MAARLVKTIIRLEFEEALRPWLEARDLFRVASADENFELKGEPHYFEHEDRKQRVGFNMREVSFEQEGNATSEAAIRNALDTFSKLHAVSHLPVAQKVEMNSAYVEPSELSFDELRTLIREAYLQPTELARLATDIGVRLEIDEGHRVKNVELGPMAPRQLQEKYLCWSLDDLPGNFLFLGLSSSWNVETYFSPQELQSVLEEAQAWQESTVQLVRSDISVRAGV